MSKINSIPFYMRTMFGWPICRLNIFFRCLIGMQNPVLARYIPLLFDSNHCQHERSSEKHWLTVFFFAYYVCLSVQAMTRARTRKQWGRLSRARPKRAKALAKVLAATRMWWSEQAYASVSSPPRFHRRRGSLAHRRHRLAPPPSTRQVKCFDEIKGDQTLSLFTIGFLFSQRRPRRRLAQQAAEARAGRAGRDARAEQIPGDHLFRARLSGQRGAAGVAVLRQRAEQAHLRGHQSGQESLLLAQDLTQVDQDATRDTRYTICDWRVRLTN